MEKVEKRFIELMTVSKIDLHKFKRFKKEFPNMYSLIVKSITTISLEDISNDVLILEKFDISKVTKAVLKEGVIKNYIFCGVFRYKKKKVILLENISTFGTYILEDTKLSSQLENWRVGETISLERTEKGVDMVFKQRDTGGLFDE